MFRTLTACLFAGIAGLGAGDSGALARPSWWNADWACRAKLTVDSGFYERHDLVLSREVNFDDWLKKAGTDGVFDAKSPRVLWLHGGQQEEVPSRFIPGPGSAAQGTLLWQRPGVMGTMTKEQFFIYFDALGAALKPAPKPCSLEVPGNLVVNGGFEEADPKDPTRPLSWEYRPKSDGGAVEWVKGVAHSGQYSLKLSAEKGSVSAWQYVKVRPGRRYMLFGWVKGGEKCEGGVACTTAWFAGPDRKGVPTKGGVYGNYKNQMDFRASTEETPWVEVSGSSVGAFDPALKAEVDFPQGRLAPGTGTARIEVSAAYDKGKISVLFDDVEFKEFVEGQPVQIVVDAVEKK